MHCPALKPHSAPFCHLRHLTQHLASMCMQTAKRCRKHPLLCSWTHFTVKTTFQMGPKHCQPPRYISLKDSPFLSQINCSTLYLISPLQHPISILIGDFPSSFIVMEDAVERSPLILPPPPLPPASPPLMGVDLSSLSPSLQLVIQIHPSQLL